MNKPDAAATVPIRRSSNGSYAIDDALFLSARDVALLIMMAERIKSHIPDVRDMDSLQEVLTFHRTRRALADRDVGLGLPPL